MLQVSGGKSGDVNYEYNGQGSLLGVYEPGRTVRIQVDKTERVTSANGLRYQHDEDGFLVLRGALRFSFNSQGEKLRWYASRYLQ